MGLAITQQAPQGSKSHLVRPQWHRPHLHRHRHRAAWSAGAVLQHGHTNFVIRQYIDASGELMQAATFDSPGGSTAGNEHASGSINPTGQRDAVDALEIVFPSRDRRDQQTERGPPMIRVRLSVSYRVHSRQMLCIGGSQIPFGWSFLSIAKVPMVWNQGDIWTAEVEMPVATKMEYKYVILEEQDWTKQENEDAEGLVTFSYRTEPQSPPDVQTIQKQMAIVAWQPGPNRVVQVPTLEEVSSLSEGEVRRREPAKLQRQTYSAFRYGASRGGPARLVGSLRDISAEEQARWDAELAGTRESISLDINGQCLVERRDVWGREPLGHPGRGLRFG